MQESPWKSYHLLILIRYGLAQDNKMNWHLVCTNKTTETGHIWKLNSRIYMNFSHLLDWTPKITKHSHEYYSFSLEYQGFSTWDWLFLQPLWKQSIQTNCSCYFNNIFTNPPTFVIWNDLEGVLRIRLKKSDFK